MDTDLGDKLRFLASAACPADSSPIEQIETHMSWVLLSGDRALKLKKPVRTAWFDFTTVAGRERDAREEVRLNRRLAPDVYQDLLVLCRDGERFALLPQAQAPRNAQVVDWLVQMRRLPADRMLDRMIAQGTVVPAHVDALLDVLLEFYRRAPVGSLSADEYVARFVSEQAVNRDVLSRPQFALDEAPRVLDAFDAALAEHAPLLRERVARRRIVDGHGDLRPEHVCLLPKPVVIDALEFSAALRQVDPFDELAFLGLECALAGASWIGPHLLSRAAGELADDVPAELLALYVAARALLRARLSAAHLLDGEVRTPSQWLPRARRYVQRAQQALHEGLSAATPHGCA